jgi:deoxyribonuclease IV
LILSGEMIGLHVSISGSIDQAFDRAQAIGSNTFQIFTRNPNQWRFKPLPDESVGLFKQKRKETGFKRVVAHMPYLPNLASPIRGTIKLSRQSLTDEVQRCDRLGIDYLVVHLGSHLGKGIAVGMNNVAEACKEALAASEGDTMVLLENTAGQKNSVGSRFEEIGAILEKTGFSERMGVCIDTCHSFAAGFDLTSSEGVDETMKVFEDCVGFRKLKVVHLNDSKGGIGNRLDRHESIGKGKIGKKGLKAFLHYPGILDRPVIMETPYNDEKDMIQSIMTVKGLLK